MLEYSLIKQHRPAVQRPAARRQELPVPRGHARRAVAAGAGHARPQAQGHPLLRPVRARLRDPRHARPAAAQLPDPHVQPGQVQRAPAARPAVPAVPHREVQRPVRRRDRRDAVPPAGAASCATSSTATPTRSSSGSRPRCATRRRRSSSSRRRGCATGCIAVRKAIEKQQMVADRNEDIDVIGIADDELEASVQVFFVRKGRVVGRKGFILDKVEELTPGGLVDRILEEMYGDEPPTGVPEAGAGAGRARRPAPRTRSGCRHLRGVTGADPGAAARRQARRCTRRSRATPRRSSCATACAAPATTTPAAGRSPSCRTCSACPRRRCASSATTWPTCRAPTTSGRWSCSRTGCRTSASTAGSR